MNEQIKEILICAGETSGDMHAANLVKEVKKIAPDIKFYGMGANFMSSAGVKLLVNSDDLGIIGAGAIFTKITKIIRSFRIMKKALKTLHPDLLVLVDYPGFNLRLAKAAKVAKVKVLYFISPKVWAWHQNRIKNIKKYVDVMAVIFPFEVEFYKKFNIHATFVGNPLLKLVKPKLTYQQTLKIFNVPENHKVIGLFPGSRASEIKRLLPIMLKAAVILNKRYSNLQFLLPIAACIDMTDLKPHLLKTNLHNIQLIKSHNYDVMQVCDAIIAASGTAVLEIAIMEIPLVITYKTSWLEYQIAKKLIKIPFVGLCNILLNKKIVQELLQDEATPENIAKEIEKLLDDTNYRQTMISNLIKVKKALQNSKQKNLAELILKQ